MIYFCSHILSMYLFVIDKPLFVCSSQVVRCAILNTNGMGFSTRTYHYKWNSSFITIYNFKIYYVTLSIRTITTTKSYCSGFPFFSFKANFAPRVWHIIKTLAPSQYKEKFPLHDDVIKWKHFPRYWPFVRGIHRSRWIPRTKASDAELWCFLSFTFIYLNKRLSK